MKQEELTQLAAKIEQQYEADLLVYVGPVVRNWDDHLIDTCRERTKKRNVLLMLTTLGGDAHAAYRIARCLSRCYNSNTTVTGDSRGEVIICVPSVCASAGTLITLASDRLILSDHAELGPLDVQIRKPDEVGERTSGLTPVQALNFLEDETQKFFKAQFEGLRFARSLSFSTRMAADVASQLATGLLSRQYEQIDPLRLAEYDRLMRIAQEYGERIKTGNVKPHAIKKLLEGYPAHEFCIDPLEARELFNRVEEPTAELENLGNFLKGFADKYIETEKTAVFYLTEEVKPANKEEHENETGHSAKREGAAGISGNGNKESETAGAAPAAAESAAIVRTA